MKMDIIEERTRIPLDPDLESILVRVINDKQNSNGINSETLFQLKSKMKSSFIIKIFELYEEDGDFQKVKNSLNSEIQEHAHDILNSKSSSGYIDVGQDLNSMLTLICFYYKKSGDEITEDIKSMITQAHSFQKIMKSGSCALL